MGFVDGVRMDLAPAAPVASPYSVVSPDPTKLVWVYDKAEELQLGGGEPKNMSRTSSLQR